MIMAAAAAGLGAGGMYVCHQMNQLTNEIANSVEDIANTLGEILEEMEECPEQQNEDRPTNRGFKTRTWSEGSFASIESSRPNTPTLSVSLEAVEARHFSRPPSTEMISNRNDIFPDDALSSNSSEGFAIQTVEPETIQHYVPFNDVLQELKLRFSSRQSEKAKEDSEENEPRPSANEQRRRCAFSIHENESSGPSRVNMNSVDQHSNIMREMLSYFNEKFPDAIDEDEQDNDAFDDENLILNESPTSDDVSDLQTKYACSGKFVPCVLNCPRIHDIDRQLNGNSSEREEAFYNLRLEETEYPHCSELLWRLAKGAHHVASISYQDPEKKREMTFLANEYAKRAVEANENNGKAHKWFAVTLIAKNDYVSVREKIESLCGYRKHMDLAVKLRPRDVVLHHSIGEWCYQLSKVPWQDQKEAGVLCWCLLNATLDDAIPHFEQAYVLKPKWKHNIYYLTKTNLELKKYHDALSWARKGLELPNESEEDEVEHNELENIVSILSTYPKRNSHNDINAKFDD